MSHELGSQLNYCKISQNQSDRAPESQLYNCLQVFGSESQFGVKPHMLIRILRPSF